MEPSSPPPYQARAIVRDSIIHKSAGEICRFIEGRGLLPGDALPPETVLSEMLGVSRNSIRESLRVLDALGYIEKRAGRESLVKAAFGASREHTIGDSEVVVALPTAIEVRRSVETRCAELAAQAGTEDDFRRMKVSLETFENATQTGDVFAAAHAHLSFHDMLIAAARNKFMNGIYHQVRFMIADIGAIGAKELFLEPKHFAMHWAIYDAVKARDAKAARAAVRFHFRAAGPLRQFILKNSVSKNKRTPASRAAALAPQGDKAATKHE